MAILGEDSGYLRGAPQAGNWPKTIGSSAAAKVVVLAGAKGDECFGELLSMKDKINLGDLLLEG